MATKKSAADTKILALEILKKNPNGIEALDFAEKLGLSLARLYHLVWMLKKDSHDVVNINAGTSSPIYRLSGVAVKSSAFHLPEELWRPWIRPAGSPLHPQIHV